MKPVLTSGRQKLMPSKETFVQLIPYLIVVGMLIYVGVSNAYFFKTRNILTILVAASSTALMAFGMTFVMITGGIDLSIPPVMALSAILGAKYMTNGGSVWIAVLIMFAIGIAFGALNGFAVAKLKMIPFIVTLSTQSITYGACQWITKSEAITGIDEGFVNAVMFKIGDVALPVFVMFLLMIVLELFMRKSYLGRWFFYTGSNEGMAKISGIPTERVVFSSYVMSGVFATLAGIVLMARMASASANFGQDTVVMDIVGAAVIGGTSVSGGRGTAVGTVFGAIFISLIVNAANMLNVSYNAMLILKGCLIILFVAIDGWARRRRHG